LHQAEFLPVAADGQALPFADGSFDAVICQLGLLFADPKFMLRILCGSI
jgi:ubiquinone/menaquinone biosynthesis C-methylase UbiE